MKDERNATSEMAIKDVKAVNDRGVPAMGDGPVKDGRPMSNGPVTDGEAVIDEAVTDGKKSRGWK